MIENVTIGQIVTIGATLMTLGGLITWLMKPIKTLDKRLTAIEQHLDNDNRRLTNNEEYQKIMAKATLALIEHSVDGNHTAQLKAMKEEMRNYFINSK